MQLYSSPQGSILGKKNEISCIGFMWQVLVAEGLQGWPLVRRPQPAAPLIALPKGLSVTCNNTKGMEAGEVSGVKLNL